MKARPITKENVSQMRRNALAMIAKSNYLDYRSKQLELINNIASLVHVFGIDDNTDGFIYMVSSAAITGAQKSFDEQKQEYFRRIDAMNLRNPRMIGFGISNKQTLQAAQSHAAGAIIGSKFVTLLNETCNADEALRRLFAALESDGQ